MVKKIFACLLLATLLAPFSAAPQQTAAHDDPEATYRKAKELFSKEQYGAARKLFISTMEAIDDPTEATHANATLYAAICAAELFNPDAASMIESYLKANPAHHGHNTAWFHLGNISYRERNYEDAVRHYGRLGPQDIDRDRRNEFVFKKGYSHFMTESYPLARQLFSQITNPGSHYFGPARYYYGHIAYLNGDYERAIRSFDQLTDDRHFGPIVPYYIVHIYYLQEQYDALLEHAPALLAEAAPRRAAEIRRMMGDAHFNRGEFAEAIPHLEEYILHSRGMAGREDHYQLGFALYKNGRYDEAIPHLERATAESDALGQNAYYHLASAYIETGQKRFARNAFYQAYQADFSEQITSESLFKYALLSFELSYDPHNEAILSLQRYISDYPDSPRREQAHAYLADLYSTTRNYSAAVTALEQIERDTPRLRKAYQRASFYRGVELFNNGDFEAAIACFERSQAHQDDHRLFATSLYWKGEAQYRLRQFEEAARTLSSFLQQPGAQSLDIYHQGQYALGYARFKLEDYGASIAPFRQFAGAADEDPRMVNDALLRIGDAYFMTKQYQPALDWYNRAIGMDIIDTDYAVFQKGLVQGITADFETKITTLQSLIRDYPGSSFVDDSKYEIANTWLILNDNTRAMQYFGDLLENHPNSSYAQSAKLKTGLIHYNENEDEKALEVFKRVVEQYPGTPQAEEALASVRTIYVGLDRVDAFVRFTEHLGIADITAAQEDSLMYQAAETRYMQGDCANAIQSFANYLERFPSGIFAAHAHYYRSECLFRTNEQERALDGYRFVIERPRSMFLENALLRASDITYQQGNYADALNYFRQLADVAERPNNATAARKGIMRTSFRLNRYEDAIEAANIVIADDRVSQSDEQEAYHVRGLAAMATGQTELAGESFERVVRIAENRRGAEAMYNLALISFKQGEYDQTEEQIFDYVNRLSAHDYWLARTFLLLADLYIETGNTFQARHTLESIIQNYDGEELTREAQSRLAFIEEQEAGEEDADTDDSRDIDFDRTD